MAARQSSSKLASAAPGRFSNVSQLREGMLTSLARGLVLIVVVRGEYLDAAFMGEQHFEKSRHIALVGGDLDGFPTVVDLNVVGELLQFGRADGIEFMFVEEVAYLVGEPF